MAKLRSIIKYPGSKQLMLAKLFKHLPSVGETLVEPFLGSASVALNTHYDKYLLNDANPDLINLYKMCQAKPDELLADIKNLFVEKNNNEATYLFLRRQYNESRDLDERSTLLCYFNRYGFNGLIRYNRSGILNVPFGDGAKPYLPEREIYQFHEKMQNATFYCMDFEAFITLVSGKEGNLTGYFDPPYLDGKNGKKSFTQYVAEGFSLSDHHRLNKCITDHRSRFNKVLVSNHQSDLLSSIYCQSTRTVKFRVPRTISSKASTRKPVSEVLLYY